MSNLMINWRLWRWHLQVVRHYDWVPYLRGGRSPVRLSYNRSHPGPWWPPVALYEGRRYALALALLGVVAWML